MFDGFLFDGFQVEQEKDLILAGAKSSLD